MKLLLHICCGPCATYITDKLIKQNVDFTGYFYNPNIHPKDEYERRKQALKQLSETQGFDVIYDGEYGIVEFVSNVCEFENERCDYCYTTRLEQTVKYAKQNGYDSFSTTLLISPYQKHDKIIEICNRLAKKYDIKFYYEDFRQNFREGQKMARELGLYMQKYCGCIYSRGEKQTSEKSNKIGGKTNAKQNYTIQKSK